MAMKVYKILGIQAATIGLTYPLMAKVDVIVINKMYEKLRAKPIPIFKPIPPLTFLEEREAPIAVRMKAAMIVAYRL